MSPVPPLHPSLAPIDIEQQCFQVPEKRIHTHADLDSFVESPGYIRVVAFLNHLNASVSPLAAKTLQELNQDSEFTKPGIAVHHFYTNSPDIEVTKAVEDFITIFRELKELVTQCPPSTGPRRFGNVAFRDWHNLAVEQAPALLDKYLPKRISQKHSTKSELLSYIIGSFGSAQRLDYGTGHELSFLAFMGGVWVLGGFTVGKDEQALVLRALPAYLDLIRTLVKTYTLEPAGSHGVWGLDDHSFLPYIFGSSQLTTEFPQAGHEPNYTQLDVPKPGDVAKKAVVDKWRERNLYFDAVGFIYDVKKGAFWEHSPILFDISGVREGWGKINMGMIKMYKAEVLGKFPVVQHFPFGSLYQWTESNGPRSNDGNVPQQQNSHSAGMIDSQRPTGMGHPGIRPGKERP